MSFPEPHLLLTGGSDKKVKTFDLRDKNPDGRDFGTHLKSVLSIASEGNMVFTGSDDKTVKLWDLRKQDEPVAKTKVGGVFFFR